ncbi:MAG: bifunctional DNA primase/polymerase, partial [Phycisphaeraceae bacterium]|nr:bifunctional DNA primase/polymerase [Phycisphaeraceae bacterium]
MIPLEAACTYCRRGWAVIPIPYRSKNPGLEGWQRLRLREEDLAGHFGGGPQNIGVLLGEPSGWLVDVDLDHRRCVEMADKFLPATPAVFGRAGKPRSHRLYRVTRAVATRKLKSRSEGMLVELRSSGLQTVFPPSVHESGEAIEWEASDAEPLLVDPDELLAAVEQLAATVRAELGEQVASNPRRPPPGPSPASQTTRMAERVRACVAAMLRMRMDDHQDGSARLFAAACRVVEHGLSDDEGLVAIRDYARQRPFPVSWSDQDILQRLRDAEHKVERGVIRRESIESGKTKVLLDPDEHRVVCETVTALAADDTIFQRGGVLVRVIREPPEPPDAPERGPVHRHRGSPTITLLPQPALRERMTKFIEFTQLVRRGDNSEEVVTHPTQWLVAAVEARGEWPGIRHLRGVSDVPILRPDGSLWQTPGYDEQTGVLYEPAATFPVIADDVTADDAEVAAAELLDVVCDFRFEGDDHRAAWLAGLLTPLARFAFEGPTPLFLIDANVRGAGKSLLAQTI